MMIHVFKIEVQLIYNDDSLLNLLSILPTTLRRKSEFMPLTSP